MVEKLRKVGGGRKPIYDILKGLGMILVVLGHTTRDPALMGFIYSFHMPLFFFVSGMLFHAKKGFVVKQLRALGIPYLSFCLLSFIYWRFLELPFRKVQDVDTVAQFVSIFYPTGGGDSYLFNVVMWFLPCLFFASVFFYFLQRWLSNNDIILLLVTLAVVLFNTFIRWRFPFFIPAALCALPFFVVGNYLQQYASAFESRGIKKKWLYVGGAVSVLLAYIIWSAPVTMDMRLGVYAPCYFVCFLVALMGIFVAAFVSMEIKENKVIEWIGRNSLIIMCCHEPIKRIILMIFARGTGQEIEAVRCSFVQSLLVTLVIIACLFPVVYAINRWGRFLIGKLTA